MSSAARSASRPCSGRTSAASNSGSPTGPLQHGRRRQARVDRLLGKRGARRTDRGGADQPLVELDLGREHLEHEPRLLGDLRPDPVPRQEDDAFATRRQVLPR